MCEDLSSIPSATDKENFELSVVLSTRKSETKGHDVWGLAFSIYSKACLLEGMS